MVQAARKSAAAGSAAIDSSMRECIEACEYCHSICLEMAMNHCLESGGRHVEPRHFRLMVNCAEICRTAADFMLSGSHLHNRICEVCAEVCEDCAQSCQELGDMEKCVQACRMCAKSCREMASA
jgi:hypothetical protein